MLKVKLRNKSASIREKYRQYSPTKLTNAYQKIINKEMTVYKASKVYQIPKTTLLDRVSGRVDIDTVKSGPDPVLSLTEEAKLAEHIQQMALYGYGYTRSEVVTLASDLATASGKREKGSSFSLQWFRSFMDRWPELKLTKPRALDISRAKSASQGNVDNYFSELENIFNQYGLHDKPHCIYNIDEKGVNFQHTPPKVVSGSVSKPPAITSDRSNTVTIIGAGNAMGTQIPPFIVFPGARMRQELLDGCTVGTSGTVSSTGWSNTEIFKQYLQEHFINYVQGLSSDQHILVIYDGHKSHVAISVIEWAKAHNIILMVLPAHTSHILQPLDVGCYGPLSRILNNTCHKFMRENHSPITRYNIGKLASESYAKALSPENLKAAFRKTGICPLDSGSIDKESTLPSKIFVNVDKCTDNDQTVTIDRDQTVTIAENDHPMIMTSDSQTVPADDDHTVTADSETVTTDENFDPALFFSQKEKQIVNLKKSKPRKVLSRITSGKAITEDNVFCDIKQHCEKNKKSVNVSVKRKRNGKCDKSAGRDKNVERGNKRKMLSMCSQEAGPSELPKNVCDDVSSDSEDDVPEKDCCCVCKKFSPDELRECVSLVFVSWGKCMYGECEHWTHLKFCCDVRALRRHSVFYCPCHDLPCLQNE